MTAASMAADLMGYLPTFPAATIDEIIDIRDLLAGHTAQFRRTISECSMELDVLSPGYEHDVAHLWLTKVGPAIEEIQTDVHDHKIQRWTKTVGEKNFLVTVGAMATGWIVGGSVTAGLAAGASLAATNIDQHLEFVSQLRKQPFWYLYSIEKELQQ